MSYLDESWADHQRRRWLKPNAHLYMRPDAARFMRPDAARFRDPDQARWNPYLAAREASRTQAHAVAALSESTAPRSGEPVDANKSGTNASQLLNLKSDLAALRVKFAVIKHEIAIRRTRGLPPFKESEEGWQVFLRSLDRYQEACRKAGFNPDQPRAPTGSPDGGQWTSGDAGAGRNDPRRLSDATSDNDWKPAARYA